MLIEYYLPEKTLTNAELATNFPGWDFISFEKKIGIKKRHLADSSTTSLDLAEKACLKVLRNLDKSEIDFLLLCTQSPDYFIPTTACILQDRLGLETRCGALDINMGCSGYLYGLALAKSLLSSGIARSVLFVVAETYSKHIYPKDRMNRALFGDGAAATVVTTRDVGNLGEFELYSDGSGYDKLIIRNGGLRNPYDFNAQEKVYGDGNIYTDNHLFMDGPEIFNFTLEKIPELIYSTLHRNNIDKEEVDYYILHQANAFMLDVIRKKIQVPIGKFHNSIEETGNTVSATIPIAIKDALDHGLIEPGHKVLLAGFGVGLSWGATIVKI